MSFSMYSSFNVESNMEPTIFERHQFDVTGLLEVEKQVLQHLLEISEYRKTLSGAQMRDFELNLVAELTDCLSDEEVYVIVDMEDKQKVLGLIKGKTEAIKKLVKLAKAK